MRAKHTLERTVKSRSRIALPMDRALADAQCGCGRLLNVVVVPEGDAE